MQVYAATGNAGKLRELQNIFDGAFDVLPYPGYASPAEGETSYAENAALKARALRRIMLRGGAATAVVADDSGLEIRALGGAPGILSARYGREGASWAERRAGLLGELAAGGSADRSARFVSAVHFITADGREFAALGTVEGEIPLEERGEDGFSYDAIFYDPARGKTYGELPAEIKNAISHRARAAAELLERLRAARLVA